MLRKNIIETCTPLRFKSIIDVSPSLVAGNGLKLSTIIVVLESKL